MRRRADQHNARHRVPEFGNDRTDLVPRQLAAFARFGALRHLDFDFLGAGQVSRRYAEASAGHLLDGRIG